MNSPTPTRGVGKGGYDTPKTTYLDGYGGESRVIKDREVTVILRGNRDKIERDDSSRQTNKMWRTTQQQPIRTDMRPSGCTQRVREERERPGRRSTL